MTHFVVGDDRCQSTLFPERLDDYLGEDNPVRAIDVLVEELDLVKLGFDCIEPEATGRPAYHPATLLKVYVHGYLNRVQSSRRLERECQHNIELVWLTGRLMPDFKTLADSVRTIARPSARSAVSSWCCADALSYSAKRALRATAANSTRDRNFTPGQDAAAAGAIDENCSLPLAARQPRSSGGSGAGGQRTTG